MIVELEKATLAFKALFPLLDTDLDRELDSRGFAIPSPGRNVLRVSQDGRETVAIRWTKGDTEVFYDPGRAMLSSEGRSPQQVAEAFGELCDVAQSLLGGTFDAQLKWSELNAVVRSAGTKQPLTSIGAHADPLIASIGNLLGAKTQRFSVTACSPVTGDALRPLTELEDWSFVSVEPLIANPGYYLTRVVIRRSTAKPIAEFTLKLENFTQSVISHLEKDHQ